MHAVAYTVRMVPDVDWDGAINSVKKIVELSNRDDNSMIACRALFPNDGLRRVTYLCDFKTVEDASTWWTKTSDEYRAAMKESQKYFVFDHKTTNYWTLD